MKFLDEAKIFLESGHGGSGAISFRREKYIEFGGPDGGNGGRGGHVIIECVNGLNTLIDFRYTQHFRASRGRPGEGGSRSGKAGEDIVVRVPVGTVILDEDKKTVLLDMIEPGQRIIFLRGGDGGFGNEHYKSSTNRAPRRNSPGWPGEERAVWLRLKLIADAGLVGMPNAGKSTFLSVVSRAKPKIADYPFTTLAPNLGVVYIHGQEFVLADIPGLIEGAHEGHGLGTRFLGHVERCRVLLHLIDATQDDVVEAYHTIRNELSAYGNGLDQKEEVIVLSKLDAIGEDVGEYQRETLSKALGKPVHLVSAASHKGIDHVLSELLKHITEGRAREQEEKNTTITLPAYSPEQDSNY